MEGNVFDHFHQNAPEPGYQHGTEVGIHRNADERLDAAADLALQQYSLQFDAD